MKTSIKGMARTVFLVAPAFALASAFSLPAVADDHSERACSDTKHKGKKGKYGKHGRSMNVMSERMQKKLAKKLDLTGAQTESFATIFANNSVDMQGQREATCMMHDKLAALTPGSAEYNQQIDEIANARAIHMAASMKSWGQAQADITAMLNDEQKEEFAEMLAHMKKRRH